MSSTGVVIEQDLEHVSSGLREELAGFAGKKVLVTGGAGFLGYYLVQAPLHWNRTALRGDPVQVTVMDSYIRGMPSWLEKLEQNEPKLRLMQHDITEPLPELDDFDLIIHAASIASPTYYRRYPIETMDANVNGLRYLLEYCRVRADQGKPVDGLLFFSTSEIYGDPDPDNIPTPETYRGNVSCTGPRACYDESKRYGETLCVNFAGQHGVPVKTARPFNNYGPGLKLSDRRVIPDFARDVLAGRDITMLSDGSPTRTYCYVADAVVGYYKILMKGRVGEAYNIGTESPEISILDLAERIVGISRDLFGYRGRVVRGSSSDPNYLVDNPNRRCPDIGKARADLNYSPSIQLEEGLRRSLQWYRDDRDSNPAEA